MAKNSQLAYGAQGSSNVMLCDPHKLVLVETEDHPLYDPRVHDAVDRMLVESIKLKGVVKPCIIWKDPESGIVGVVDGRQRVKAARVANDELKAEGSPPKLVPCVVGKGDSKTIVGTVVVANEGHSAPTAIGRARFARKLQGLGYADEQIGTLLHMSKSSLRNCLGLLEATGVVQRAVESGKIPVTAGYDLARLEPEQQKSQLSTMLEAVKDEPAPTGKKGSRKRAAKMREATGKAPTRRRPEIEAKLSDLKALRETHEIAGMVRALKWVLGGKADIP